MRHHRLSCLSYHQVIGAACTGGCAPLVSRLSAKHRCPEGENPCSLRLAVSLSSYGCSSLCGSAGGGVGMAAAEHPLLRHGASSSIRHSDTSNRSGNANSFSGTMPNPVHPPALLTLTPARRLSASCRAPRAGTKRRNRFATSPSARARLSGVSSSPAHSLGQQKLVVLPDRCAHTSTPGMHLGGRSAGRGGLLADHLRRRMASERISTPAAFSWCSSLPTPLGITSCRRAGQPEDRPCPERRRTSR